MCDSLPCISRITFPTSGTFCNTVPSRFAPTDAAAPPTPLAGSLAPPFAAPPAFALCGACCTASPCIEFAAVNPSAFIALEIAASIDWYAFDAFAVALTAALGELPSLAPSAVAAVDERPALTPPSDAGISPIPPAVPPEFPLEVPLEVPLATSGFNGVSGAIGIVVGPGVLATGIFFVGIAGVAPRPPGTAPASFAAFASALAKDPAPSGAPALAGAARVVAALIAARAPVSKTDSERFIEFR
jgi:hypothetical protein